MRFLAVADPPPMACSVVLFLGLVVVSVRSQFAYVGIDTAGENLEITSPYDGTIMANGVDLMSTITAQAS